MKHSSPVIKQISPYFLVLLMVTVAHSGIQTAHAQLYAPPASRSEAKDGAGGLPPTSREPYLSELNRILQAGTGPLAIHLCFPAGTEFTVHRISQAAAVTQALALRAGYRTVEVSHGSDPQPGRLNVMLGTVDEIEGLLPASQIEKINHAYLALRRLRESGSYLLIVAGRELTDVDSAVLGLGMLNQALPELSSADIRSVIIPSAPPFFRRPPLQSDHSYTFSELEENGADVTAAPNGDMTMQLFYPGFLRREAKGMARIDLHFDSKAGAFGPNGALEILLNGTALEVPSAGRSSAGASELSIEFPVDRFEYGRNTLELKVGPRVQIFSDSRLSLPSIEQGVSLPDLRITSRTFYPFIGQPDGSDIAVYLQGSNPDLLDSAWTILARFAQSANTFFYATQFTFEEPDPKRNLVVIGNYEDLPKKYRSLVALTAFETGYAATPLAELEQSTDGLNLYEVIQKWLGQDASSEVSPQSSSGTGADAGFLACQPPTEEGEGWFLVLTALGDDRNLLERTRDLVDPEFWDMVRGDIVRWKAEPGTMEAHSPNDVAAQVVAIDWSVEMPFGEAYPFRFWICLVSGTLLLCILLSASILKKYDALVGARQRRPR